MVVATGKKNIRMKDYAAAYNSGFAWMLILIGLALLAAGRLFPDLAMVGFIGQWLAIVNAVGIVLILYRLNSAEPKPFKLLALIIETNTMPAVPP